MFSSSYINVILSSIGPSLENLHSELLVHLSCKATSPRDTFSHSIDHLAQANIIQGEAILSL